MPKLWTPSIVRPPMPVVDGALRELRRRERARWRHARDPQLDRRCSIVPIETVAADSNAASPAVTTLTWVGVPTTAGELIVVQTFSSGATDATPTVTDSASQIYTKIFELKFASNRSCALWYKENSAAGVTSVTVTNAGTNDHGGAIGGHYAGVRMIGSLDVNSGTPSLSADTPWSSGSVTTTQSDELLIGVVWGFFNGTNATFSASGGWSQDKSRPSTLAFDGNNGNGMAFAHQIVSSFQANIANTGTNPGAGVNNYPGIATFVAARNLSLPNDRFPRVGDGMSTSGRC